VLHAVYSFCLLQWTIPLNSVSKWLFFSHFSWYSSIRGLREGPGKILTGVLESPGFFSVKEWEPCLPLSCIVETMGWQNQPRQFQIIHRSAEKWHSICRFCCIWAGAS